MTKEKLFILDLDRTLVDVSKVMEITEKICTEMGIDFNRIYKDQKDLQSRGTAYSPFSYIASHSNVDNEGFKRRFCDLAESTELLFPDASELLNKLNDKQIDFIVITHGVDDEWQKLKLKAAGLDKRPYLIVKDRYKSRIITGWIKGDNEIKPDLAGLSSYKSFIFIDDRSEAFADFPSRFGVGYLIDRFQKIDHQVLPENVKIISDLNQLDC